jgi:hypothetical protein
MSRYKPLQMFDPVDPDGPVRDLPVTRAVIATERPLQMFDPVDPTPSDSADIVLLDQLIQRLGLDAVRRRVERHAQPTP